MSENNKIYESREFKLESSIIIDEKTNSILTFQNNQNIFNQQSFDRKISDRHDLNGKNQIGGQLTQSGKSKASETRFLDLFMHFSPIDSNKNLLFSPSLLSFTCSSDSEAMAVGTGMFRVGSDNTTKIVSQTHIYWEISIPSANKNISIGVVKIDQTGEVPVISKSITHQIDINQRHQPDILGVVVNTEDQHLTLIYARNQKSEAQVLQPGIYKPCVIVKGVGTQIILNPFFTIPVEQELKMLQLPAENVNKEAAKEISDKLESVKIKINNLDSEIKPVSQPEESKEGSSEKQEIKPSVQEEQDNVADKNFRNLHYCRKGDNILVQQGCYLKLIRRNTNGYFDLNFRSCTMTGNIVSLPMTTAEAQFLINNLDFRDYFLFLTHGKSKELMEVLEAFNTIEQVDGDYCVLRIDIATIRNFINKALEMTIQQFYLSKKLSNNEIKQKLNTIRETLKDIFVSNKSSSSVVDVPNIQLQAEEMESNLEIAKILSVLDEQLFALGIKVGDRLDVSLRNRYRIQTAFACLGSLLTFTYNKYKRTQIADAGLFSSQDFIQELTAIIDKPQNLLEDFEGSPENTSIEEETQAQTDCSSPFNAFTCNPTIIVPLYVTVNSVPPSHSGAPLQLITPEHSNLNSVYVSTIEKSGKLVIWNTELMLFQVIESDFRSSDSVQKQKPKPVANPTIENQGTAQTVDEEMSLFTFFEDDGQTDPNNKTAVDDNFVPNPDFLEQLVMLGFDLETSKQALKETKNASLDLALDIITTIAASKEQKTVDTSQSAVAKIQMIWVCQICTFQNMNSNATCDVCGSNPPDSAYMTAEELKREENQTQGTAINDQQTGKKDENSVSQPVPPPPPVVQKELTYEQKINQLVNQNSDITSVIHINLKHSLIAPVIVGVVFNEKNDDPKNDFKSLIRFRRFGFETQDYLQGFTRVNTNTSKGYTVTINNEWISNRNENELIDNLLQNDSVREVVETLYPIYVGNYRFTTDKQFKKDELFHIDWVTYKEFNFEFKEQIVDHSYFYQRKTLDDEHGKITILTKNQLNQYSVHVFGVKALNSTSNKGNYSIDIMRTVKLTQILKFPQIKAIDSNLLAGCLATGEIGNIFTLSDMSQYIPDTYLSLTKEGRVVQRLIFLNEKYYAAVDNHRNLIVFRIPIKIKQEKKQLENEKSPILKELKEFDQKENMMKIFETHPSILAERMFPKIIGSLCRNSSLSGQLDQVRTSLNSRHTFQKPSANFSTQINYPKPINDLAALTVTVTLETQSGETMKIKRPDNKLIPQGSHNNSAKSEIEASQYAQEALIRISLIAPHTLLKSSKQIYAHSSGKSMLLSGIVIANNVLLQKNSPIYIFATKNLENLAQFFLFKGQPYAEYIEFRNKKIAAGEEFTESQPIGCIFIENDSYVHKAEFTQVPKDCKYIILYPNDKSFKFSEIAAIGSVYESNYSQMNNILMKSAIKYESEPKLVKLVENCSFEFITENGESGEEQKIGEESIALPGKNLELIGLNMIQGIQSSLKNFLQFQFRLRNVDQIMGVSGVKFAYNSDSYPLQAYGISIKSYTFGHRRNDATGLEIEKFISKNFLLLNSPEQNLPNILANIRALVEKNDTNLKIKKNAISFIVNLFMQNYRFRELLLEEWKSFIRIVIRGVILLEKSNNSSEIFTLFSIFSQKEEYNEIFIKEFKDVIENPPEESTQRGYCLLFILLENIPLQEVAALGGFLLTQLDQHASKINTIWKSHYNSLRLKYGINDYVLDAKNFLIPVSLQNDQSNGLVTIASSSAFTSTLGKGFTPSLSVGGFSGSSFLNPRITNNNNISKILRSRTLMFEDRGQRHYMIDFLEKQEILSIVLRFKKINNQQMPTMRINVFAFEQEKEIGKEKQKKDEKEEEQTLLKLSFMSSKGFQRIIEEEKIFGDDMFTDGSESNSVELPILSVQKSRFLVISVQYSHTPFVCTPSEANSTNNNYVFPQIRGTHVQQSNEPHYKAPSGVQNTAANSISSPVQIFERIDKPSTLIKFKSKSDYKQMAYDYDVWDISSLIKFNNALVNFSLFDSLYLYRKTETGTEVQHPTPEIIKRVLKKYRDESDDAQMKTLIENLKIKIEHQQKDLQLKLTQKDSNSDISSVIPEICANISKDQQDLYILALRSSEPFYFSTGGLDFQTQISSNLLGLIFKFENQLQNITSKPEENQNQQKLQKALQTNSWKNIEGIKGEKGRKICENLFEAFVVKNFNEVSSEALRFLTTMIISNLDENEWISFFLSVIEKYLSTPVYVQTTSCENLFNQSDVISALEQMEIPIQQLFNLLMKKLEMKIEGLKVTYNNEETQNQISSPQFICQFISLIMLLKSAYDKLSWNAEETTDGTSPSGKRENHEENLTIAFSILVWVCEQKSGLHEQDASYLIEHCLQLAFKILQFSESKGRANLHHLLVTPSSNSEKEIPLFLILYRILTNENNQISSQFRQFFQELVIPAEAKLAKLQSQSTIQYTIVEFYYIEKLLEQILIFKTNPEVETVYKQNLKEQEKMENWSNNLIYITDLLFEVSDIFTERISKLDFNELKKEENKAEIEPTLKTHVSQIKEQKLIKVSQNLVKQLMTLIFRKDEGESTSPSLVLEDESQNAIVWSLVFQFLQNSELEDDSDDNLFQEFVSAILQLEGDNKQSIVPKLIDFAKRLKSSSNVNNREVINSQLIESILNLYKEIFQASSSIGIDQSISQNAQYGYMSSIALKHLLIRGFMSVYTKNADSKPIYSISLQHTFKILIKISKYLFSHLNFGGYQGFKNTSDIVLTKLLLIQDLINFVSDAESAVGPNSESAETKQKLAIEEIYGLFNKPTENLGLLKNKLNNSTNESFDETLQKLVETLIYWYIINRSTERVSSPTTEALHTLTVSLKEKIFHKIVDTKELKLKSISILFSAYQQMHLFVTSSRSGSFPLALLQYLYLNSEICFNELTEIWINDKETSDYFVFELKGFELSIQSAFNLSQNEQEKTGSRKLQKSILSGSIFTCNFSKTPQAIISTTTAQTGTATTGGPIATTTSMTSLFGSSTTSTTTTVSSTSKSSPVYQGNNSNQILSKVTETAELIEQECAQQISFAQSTIGTPSGVMDWTINMGEQHRLVVEFKGEYEEEISLIVNLNQNVEVKEIELGLVGPQLDDKTLIIPTEVTVEGGITEKSFFPLGVLTIFNDKVQRTKGTFVFGKNFFKFERIEKVNSSKDKNVMESMFSKHSKKQISFLKFSFKQVVNSMTENTSYKPQCVNKIGLSFISVKGFVTSKLPTSISSEIEEIRRQTGYNLMGKVTNQQFSTTLERLAKEKSIIKILKENFEQFCQNLTEFELEISNIILNISEYNREFNQWVFDQLMSMDLQSETAILLEEIICGYVDQSGARIDCLLGKLTTGIEQALEETQIVENTIDKLIPLIDIFNSSLIVCSENINKVREKFAPTIPLKSANKSYVVLNVFELYQKSVILESAINPSVDEINNLALHRNVKQIGNLLENLVFCPYPFDVACSIEVGKAIFNKIFEKFENKENQNLSEQFYFKIIENFTQITNQELIDVCQTKVKLFVNIATDLLLSADLGEKENQQTFLFYILKILVKFAQIQHLRDNLLSEDLFITIYSSLRKLDAAVQVTIKAQIIRQIVQFIRFMIISDKNAQEAVSTLIQNDIEFTLTNQDSLFAHSILIPILTTTLNVKLYIHPYDVSQNRWTRVMGTYPNGSEVVANSNKKSGSESSKNGGNGASNVSVQSVSSSASTGSSGQPSSSVANLMKGPKGQKKNNAFGTFNSQILYPNESENVVQRIIEAAKITNTDRRLMSGSWRLAIKQTSDKDTSVKSILKDEVLSYSPFMIIVEGTLNNQRAIGGAYVPNAINEKNEILYSDDYFLFFSQEEKFLTLKYTMQTADANKIGDLANTEYFKLQSYHYGWNFLYLSYNNSNYSYFDLDFQYVKALESGQVNNSFTIMNISKIQYWVFENTKARVDNKPSESIKISTPPSFKIPISLSVQKTELIVQQLFDLEKQSNEQKQRFAIEKELGSAITERQTKTLLENAKEKTIFDLMNSIDSNNYVDYIDLEFNLPKSSDPLIKGSINSVLEEEGGICVDEMFQKLGVINFLIDKCRPTLQSMTNKVVGSKWLFLLEIIQKYSSLPDLSSISLVMLSSKENLSNFFNILIESGNAAFFEQNEQQFNDLYNDMLKTFVETLNRLIQAKAKGDSSKQFNSSVAEMSLDLISMISQEKGRQWMDTLPTEEEVKAPKEEKDAEKDLEKEKEKEKEKDNMATTTDATKPQKQAGIGYGTDNDSSKSKNWDPKEYEKLMLQKANNLNQVFNTFLTLLQTSEMNDDESEIAFKLICESCILPLIENELRSASGSIADVAQNSQFIYCCIDFITILSQMKGMYRCLIDLDPHFQPKQAQSIFNILKQLYGSTKVYMSCMAQASKDDPEIVLCTKIEETFKALEKSIEDQEDDDGQGDEKESQSSNNEAEEQMKAILDLPLSQQYQLLLKELQFDYVSMKSDKKPGEYDHYDQTDILNNANPPPAKMQKIAQDITAIVNEAVPMESTNAIFVRCDTDRVDVMRALIFGSETTPYANGAFFYDLFFKNDYPNLPPSCHIITTGGSQTRFNPNLYAEGKVCLSLLGTWNGGAKGTENWNPGVSSLAQVLNSIQAIIMNDDIYFNEPGYEQHEGTTEGIQYNEAYANIVRVSNIKFAMIDNIRNPPKGFETIIRRHFYLKRDLIMKECRGWLDLAKNNKARYNGLVSSHNSQWCAEFVKSTDAYPNMLLTVISELEIELKKLSPPSFRELKLAQTSNKRSPQKKIEVKAKKDFTLKSDTQEIDVSYGKQENSDSLHKELDINDEQVRDRWSRYIGAMGIDAVKKQATSSIFLHGLGPVGIEIAKNIVLSGFRRVSIHDGQNVSYNDLAGQFFVSEEDIGQNRVEASMRKLKELNYYVRVDEVQSLGKDGELPQDEESIIKDLKLQDYNLVILTECDYETQIIYNQFCRKNKIFFISADVRGVWSYIFNDFGDQFEVQDRDGEDPVQVMIHSITKEENGLITLIDKAKHPYQDGDYIHLREIQGMTQNGETINGTVHQITKVETYRSFRIGDTREYTEYVRDGIAKNIKTPVQMNFVSLKQSLETNQPPYNENHDMIDFLQMNHICFLHLAFQTLSMFQNTNQRLPKNWDRADAKQFLTLSEPLIKKYLPDLKDEQEILVLNNFLFCFSFTCSSGSFPPLAAFVGGIVSQEIVKAITNKFVPIKQFLFSDACQVLPNESFPKDFLTCTDEEFENFLKKEQFDATKESRVNSLRSLMGSNLLEDVKASNIFMVGSGAIGCELLKNFAMLSVGTGQDGKIILTDPDIIEPSNLNRQFLFREKHLRKSKSQTAASAIVQMNQDLKGHIVARVDKIFEGTEHIYSDDFFQSLSVVANALDNVNARKYVDSRCVSNRIPLLESGTLGPQGHVQVIMPFKTESYSSRADPQDQEGQIPQCTLKSFPEETIHCVEWSRDKFGQLFSLKPKAANQIYEDESFKLVGTGEMKPLKDSIKLMKTQPITFEDCIQKAILQLFQYYRNDIMQLLDAYPLDQQNQNGEPFWKLPQRAPTPLEKFVPADPLHNTFVSSLAVLIAQMYKIEYPQDFRTPEGKLRIAEIASKFDIPQFEISVEQSQRINQENEKIEEEEEKQNAEKGIVKESQPQGDSNNVDIDQLNKEISEIKAMLPQNATNILVSEEFEQDDDDNGHIDFVFASANLRAVNYKLENMDWMHVKIKAGRIVPALATTTAVISGLQTIELIKLIQQQQIENMKCAYINLALSIFNFNEPGEPPKVKLLPDLSVNLWDRWEIRNGNKLTVKDLFDHLISTYKLLPNDVYFKAKPIYIQSLMDIPANSQKKEETMKSLLLHLIEYEGSEYVDFNITFTLPETKDEKELEGDKSKEAVVKDQSTKESHLQGVPQVRVYVN